MNSHLQLSERARLDGILAVLKVFYCAFGNSRLAKEKLSGKSFCFQPDLFQIFRIDYSFVFAGSFIRRVQGSRFGHRGQVGSALGDHLKTGQRLSLQNRPTDVAQDSFLFYPACGGSGKSVSRRGSASRGMTSIAEVDLFSEISTAWVRSGYWTTVPLQSHVPIPASVVGDAMTWALAGGCSDGSEFLKRHPAIVSRYPRHRYHEELRPRPLLLRGCKSARRRDLYISRKR